MIWFTSATNLSLQFLVQVQQFTICFLRLLNCSVSSSTTYESQSAIELSHYSTVIMNFFRSAASNFSKFSLYLSYSPRENSKASLPILISFIRGLSTQKQVKAQIHFNFQQHSMAKRYAFSMNSLSVRSMCRALKRYFLLEKMSISLQLLATAWLKTYLSVQWFMRYMISRSLFTWSSGLFLKMWHLKWSLWSGYQGCEHMQQKFLPQVQAMKLQPIDRSTAFLHQGHILAFWEIHLASASSLSTCCIHFAFYSHLHGQWSSLWQRKQNILPQLHSTVSNLVLTFMQFPQSTPVQNWQFLLVVMNISQIFFQYFLTQAVPSSPYRYSSPVMVQRRTGRPHSLSMHLGKAEPLWMELLRWQTQHSMQNLCPHILKNRGSFYRQHTSQVPSTPRSIYCGRSSPPSKPAAFRYSSFLLQNSSRRQSLSHLKFLSSMRHHPLSRQTSPWISSKI